MPDGSAAEVARKAGPDVLTVADYKSGDKPIWCPGCGDYGVLSAMYKALTAMQWKQFETVVVSGIGCSSRTPYFMSTYGIHGVHGRALPMATGLKLSRPDLHVLVVGGDGDLLSIGAGHMPHAAARNIDITCIMMDNQTYGLTKAQSSPTSLIGHKSKSTPYGVISKPLNPVLFALANGATFVGRGYSAKPNDLAALIRKGMEHNGFSFIHVQSPCAEFFNTYDYYDQRVELLPEDWKTNNLQAAIDLVLTEDNTHIGLFYEEERPVYEQQAHAFEAEKHEFDMAEYLQRFS
ncbi:MAG TPA: 2-oxoacid:ferredoxin oxidoreductase subunit beta [Dehalococcoidia bacterium]|nr:2-oxoacid:ferredoxin oxidoreductase subunit beta [Dehalococcoidia bacterium]